MIKNPIIIDIDGREIWIFPGAIKAIEKIDDNTALLTTDLSRDFGSGNNSASYHLQITITRAKLWSEYWMNAKSSCMETDSAVLVDPV